MHFSLNIYHEYLSTLKNIDLYYYFKDFIIWLYHNLFNHLLMDICYHFFTTKNISPITIFFMFDYFFRINFFIVKLLGQRVSTFKILVYIVKLLSRNVLMFTLTIRV